MWEFIAVALAVLVTRFPKTEPVANALSAIGVTIPSFALNLKVLEDDKSFSPKYNVSFVRQDTTLKQYPQIKDMFAPVSEKLTNKVLLKLNAQIDVRAANPPMWPSSG